MNMNEYQSGAYSTAIYPDSMQIIYPAMLAGAEAGEMQNKVQKLIRRGVLPFRGENRPITIEETNAIIDECGDQLWAIANLLMDLNSSMEHCARRNIRKLKSRMERGVIEGSGDDR